MEHEEEKRRRIYYQDIVYRIANALDILHGRKPEQGVLVGTVNEPSHAVEREIKELCVWACKEKDDPSVSSKSG
jgi:hypothetical protein